MKKLSCHVFAIKFGISYIFNIEDLVDCEGFDFNPSNFLLMSHPMSLFLRDFILPIPNILLTIVNQIDIILDDEVIMTRKYLVRWKGRELNDDSWKYQSALQ